MLEQQQFSLDLRSVLIRDYVYDGWNRRGLGSRLVPIKGWRLAVHRILWGFQGLVYIEPPSFRIALWDSDWKPVGQLVTDA